MRRPPPPNRPRVFLAPRGMRGRGWTPQQLAQHILTGGIPRGINPRWKNIKTRRRHHTKSHRRRRRRR